MLIGLAGAKGAGKDTVAALLAEKFGFARLAFATPMKRMLMALGVGEASLHDPALKELPHPALNDQTVRWGMQSLATEWGRNCLGGNVWVDAALRDLETVPADQNALFSDVRFPNEAAAIEDRGGIVIVVRRAAVEPADLAGLHPSETLWAELADRIQLHNEGSLSELTSNLEAVIETLARIEDAGKEKAA